MEMRDVVINIFVPLFLENTNCILLSERWPKSPEPGVMLQVLYNLSCSFAQLCSTKKRGAKIDVEIMRIIL